MMADISKRTTTAFTKAHELACEQGLAWGRVSLQEVLWIAQGRITYAGNVRQYWSAVAATIHALIPDGRPHDLHATAWDLSAAVALHVRDRVIYSYPDGICRAYQDPCPCAECALERAEDAADDNA